jgi:hypothetical protein
MRLACLATVSRRRELFSAKDFFDETSKPGRRGDRYPESNGI